MTRPGPSRTTLHLEEIRANLLSLRANASERLRGRQLLLCADDAVVLLDDAIAHRGNSGTSAPAEGGRRLLARMRAEAARSVRELARPTQALDRPRMRWKAASVLVALTLLLAPIAVYMLEVREFAGLRAIENFLQSTEALLAALLIIVAWSYSTWRFERQRRIEDVLEAIDRCRALILIVDAHSMAKDFSRYWDPARRARPEPVDGLGRESVIEYLAIGSAIAKLTAQVAASYGTVIHDHAVIAAIDSVSQLALSIERNALAKQDLLRLALTATRAADTAA